MCLVLIEEYSENGKASEKEALHKTESNTLPPATLQNGIISKARPCSKHLSNNSKTIQVIWRLFGQYLWKNIKNRSQRQRTGPFIKQRAASRPATLYKSTIPCTYIVHQLVRQLAYQVCYTR